VIFDYVLNNDSSIGYFSTLALAARTISKDRGSSTAG